jgi:hypothetical protein
VKPDIENIIGLNLMLVKLMTVPEDKLPLWHKISKIGMISFAKVWIDRGLVCSAKGRIFSNVLYV